MKRVEVFNIDANDIDHIWCDRYDCVCKMGFKGEKCKNNYNDCGKSKPVIKCNLTPKNFHLEWDMLDRFVILKSNSGKIKVVSDRFFE